MQASVDTRKMDLLEEVGCKHQDVSVLVERLASSEIPNALEVNLGR